MTIFSFHLFDRNCDPSITHHFHRPTHALSEPDLAKLIFGVTFSLRSTIRKLTPETPSLSALSVSGQDSPEDFFTYRTSAYALHVLETPSLLRFILLTSPDMPGSAADRILRQIYGGLYVDYILKNPLSLQSLYHASRIEAIHDLRFGAREAQSKVQRKRDEEMRRREGDRDGGTGWAQDVSMVMGCELFLLALDQFVQGLPGYQ